MPARASLHNTLDPRSVDQGALIRLVAISVLPSRATLGARYPSPVKASELSAREKRVAHQSHDIRLP